MEVRNILSTENLHPKSVFLDTLSPERIVKTIVSEIGFPPVMAALSEIAIVAKGAASAIDMGRRLIYVGAGTSGRLAVLDAAECFPTFGFSNQEIVAVIAGGKDALVHSIEGAEDDEKDAENQMRRLDVRQGDVVCGVAASGTTPFTLASIKYARRIGAQTALITCGAVPMVSANVPVADTIVYLNTGSEIISGSTRMKAGTAQKETLNAISTTAAVLLHKTYGGLMVDVQATNNKLRKRALRLVRLLTDVASDYEAEQLLHASGWSIKEAVVMQHVDVSKKHAIKMLKNHRGNLRAIIGDIDYTKSHGGEL